MTPKEQFLETPHAAEHRKTVQTEAFREALNYALLQLLESDVNQDRVIGAKEFSRILKNLATVPEVPHGTQPPSINYDAYDRPNRSR